LSYGSNLHAKYFSYDGGQHNHGALASGSNKSKKGDGFQASHWRNLGTNLGIMDPTLARGERPKISVRDLRALDVIGWDIAAGGPGNAQNIQLDYRNIYNQSRNDLAQRIGQSRSWLESNQGSAANLLADVRVADVITMAQASQNYDLSWMNPWGGASAWLNWAQQQGGQSFWLNWWHNEGGSGFWQNIDNIFEQQSFFSTLEDIEGFESGAESEIDALTGQPIAQGEAPPPSNTDFASATQKTLVQEQFESFAAGQDSILGNGGEEYGLQQSYSNMASLSLGTQGGGNGLGSNLAGLGQDQLQNAASLGSALELGNSLG